MKMRILVIIILVFVAFTHVLYAQSYKATPVTPEAAALAKMVNYPVNMNTGVPDVNIPFYTIKAGGLELPLTFMYNASGFKVNERSTRMGLGWSFSGDLQIVRNVNGLDDFGPGGYLSNTLAKAFTPGTQNYLFYNPSSVSYHPYLNAYELAVGEKDGAPDKFTYKLLNKSGTFFFQKSASGTTYSIVPAPYDDIKITYDDGRFTIVDSDGTVYHFADPGFTGDHLAKNREVTRPSTSTGGVISGWKCRQIINNTATDTITFTYTPKTDERYLTFTDRIDYYDNASPCGMEDYHSAAEYPLNQMPNYESIEGQIPFYQLPSPKYFEIFTYARAKFHLPYVNASGNFVDQVYDKLTPNVGNSAISVVSGLSLASITYRGGKVNITGADKLSVIEVLDPYSNTIKSAYFHSSYKAATYMPDAQVFNGPSFQGTLYLDSIHMQGAGPVVERYALLYKDKFCFGDHLKGKDAWGYPNESTVEMTTSNPPQSLAFPTYSFIHPRIYRDVDAGCSEYNENVPLSFGGDNWSEASSNEKMQHGILKRLVYPTGGFVDFEFEANQYKELLANETWGLRLPRYCGGLRVKSISYYDGNNYTPKSYSYYRYGDFEEGTGIVVNKPIVSLAGAGEFHFQVAVDEQKIQYLRNSAVFDCTSKSCLATVVTETKKTFRPSSVRDYTYANGSPIYYTKVTEYKHDLGQQSGKKVYEYYPPETFHDPLEAPMWDKERIPFTDLVYIKSSWMEGAQKSVSDYRFKPGTGFELARRKSYEYRLNIRSQVSAAYSYFTTIYQVVEGNYVGTHLDLYNYAEAFADFSDDGPEYNFGEYGIPIGNLLLEKETLEEFESPGNTMTATTEYAYQSNLAHIQPINIITKNSKGQEIMKNLKYSFDFNGVYDQMESKNMVAMPVEEIVSNNTTGGEISRRKTNYAAIAEGPGFIAPASIQTSNGGATLENEVTLDKYDPRANVLQYTGKDGVPVSYLWGYNYLYPVAELTGVQYNSIPATYTNNAGIINPSGDAALRTVLANLRSSFTGEPLLNTYTHKRLVGITSHTQPNGNITYYEYDNYGRLVNIKDKDLKILKSFAYQMVNPSSSDFTLFYVNMPMMKTHNVTCNNGSSTVTQMYNRYVAGGKYVHTDDIAPNMMAEGDANDDTQPPVMPCPPSSSMATVKFLALYDPFYASSRVDIDFIQNGSVVATQTYFNNYVTTPPFTTKTLKLPPGTYQVSFRTNPDVRYFDVFLDFYFASVTDSTGRGLHSTDTITIEVNKEYEINVSNIM